MVENKTYYSVFLSAHAERMLIEHSKFLAKVNTDAADQLVNDFMDLITSLEQNPERFPIFVYNNIRFENYRKAIFSKRYVAVFCVEDNNIYWNIVIDCTANNTKVLESSNSH